MSTEFRELPLGRPRILVVGDVMLDRYIWGNADRVSPEAPVLVLRVDREEARMGGAASVAGLLRGLEAGVTVAGVVGNDAPGRLLVKLLVDSEIGSAFVLTDETRTTTTKERLIGMAAGRHPHQMLRVDREDCHAIDSTIEDRLLEKLVNVVGDFDSILVSDYAKGVCTPRLLSGVIEAARKASIPLLVDPARIADCSRYRGATLLKPNRVEMGIATGCAISSYPDAVAAANRLREQLDLQIVVVTLDSDGMVAVTADGDSQHFPVIAQAVYDITGAGDMALAALGLGFASHWNLADSILLANIASGLEVGRQGVAVISRDELAAELLRQQRLKI